MRGLWRRSGRGQVAIVSGPKEGRRNIGAALIVGVRFSCSTRSCRAIEDFVDGQRGGDADQ